MFTSVAIYEVRHAFRILRKHPGFATAAVLSLAVGIGASTAIFSLLNAALLRELPVSHPEELVRLSGGHLRNSAVLSYPMVQDLAARQQVLAGMRCGWRSRPDRPELALRVSWRNCSMRSTAVGVLRRAESAAGA
jgi:hypothetical protein